MNLPTKKMHSISTTRASRTAFGCLLLLCCIGHMGCFSPAQVSLDNLRLNERLRRDRQPLDTTNQLFADPALLRFGPYRPGLGDLANPLIPEDQMPTRNLVQSDCWWLGRANGNALSNDAVRLHWEAVADLGGDVPQLFALPEDRAFDIGACRFDDPEERIPLRGKDSKIDQYEEHTCSDILSLQQGLSASSEAALPDCTDDANLYLLQLDAYNPILDSFQTCPTQFEANPSRRIKVESTNTNTDAFSGSVLTVDQGGGNFDHKVSACSTPEGYRVNPPQPTRYRIAGLSTPGWIEPVLMLADDQATLARPMTVGASASWNTPVTMRAGAGVRWQENFASRIKVQKVRLFDASGGATGVDIGLEPAPLLCITDPEGAGSACRWYCKDSAVADGKLMYVLDSAGGCFRDPLDPQNTAEIPSVTPTYAIDTLTAAALGSIDMPLTWGASLNGIAAPMIEFSVNVPSRPGDLMAQKAALDFGRMPPRSSSRGDVTVVNVGTSAVKVLSVAMESSGNFADFAPELPYAADPVPVPINVDMSNSRKVSIVPLSSMEGQQLFLSESHSAHVRYTPTDTEGLRINQNGVSLRMQKGVLFRDNVRPRYVYRSPTPNVLQPIARSNYARRSLPFIVAPGAAFDVSVLATPSTGNRRDGRVQIRFEDALAPGQIRSIFVAVTAFGLWGPDPNVYPASRHFIAHSAGLTSSQGILIVNDGDLPFDLKSWRLTGIAGSSIPPNSLPFVITTPYGLPQTIASGNSTVIDVQYVAGCDSFSGGSIGRLGELRFTVAEGTRTREFPVTVKGVSSWCP
jgi:hypothetical protein